MAATEIRLALPRSPVAKAQGHKARHANSTLTFTTSNHTNLALLPPLLWHTQDTHFSRMWEWDNNFCYFGQWNRSSKCLHNTARPLFEWGQLPYQPQSSFSVWYLPEQFWYNARLSNFEGICWGKQNMCVLLCVTLNQLDLPTPSNIPQI